MNIFEKLREILLNFSKFVRQSLTKVVLFFAYILGIGPTSIIAKLFRKQFLNSSSKKTSWRKPTGSIYLKKMY
jgi:ABC-type uncharacterized transport system permease subunit